MRTPFASPSSSRSSSSIVYPSIAMSLVAERTVKTPIAAHTHGPKPASAAKKSSTPPIARLTVAVQMRWWR
jgi:hypothetical protein